MRIVPEDVKYKKDKKFEGHIMLWLCFSEKGSKPYFLNKGVSTNQCNYLKECIQKSDVIYKTISCT